MIDMLRWKFAVIFLFSVITEVFAQDHRLLYNQPFAPSENFVSRLEKVCRKEICLNGFWHFQGMSLPAEFQSGIGVPPPLPPPDDGAWDKTQIKIPSPWNVNAFAVYDGTGPDHRHFPSYPAAWEKVEMAWMKKTVTVPLDWAGMQIRLHFEAVAGFSEIYVNGEKAAENFDLFLPFDVDITNRALPGERIDILVGVRKQSLFEDQTTVGRRIVPAGSMWGSMIAGIWQDVSLIALPKTHISDVYIKPLVSAKTLELLLAIENAGEREQTLFLDGDIRQWINNAGASVDLAPVPDWDLAKNAALAISRREIKIKPGIHSITIEVPVSEGDLNLWTPEHPHLYGLLLKLSTGKGKLIDQKYERFGWREWTIRGAEYCLNGSPCELRGDSWHFMGIPQLSRRYAWAWFTAVKAANGNAVRPHAQVYPRFYLDLADEMGICILNETAIWASDGGPKMDSPTFWENCNEHVRRFVVRDRNHPSVFGWSISNENKPVILNVFKKPELMRLQKQAWLDWKTTVATNDPSRPWISSDGEEDGEGILPITVGHYGDANSMEEWKLIGKPWGVGEHSMAYYGTPRQVSRYNGENAYLSAQKRMEGLASEAYHLIAAQRKLGASYVSVFNLAWYSLKPLPFGKKDLTTPPSLENDGVFFPPYREGVPGIQPERIGPYSSTFNPGYDPNLPLYETWPMFDAIRAANAPNHPAWSKWKELADPPAETPIPSLPSVEDTKRYAEVLFVGKSDSELKQVLEKQGIEFLEKSHTPQKAIYIVDGSFLSEESARHLKRQADQGADIWIGGITPETLTLFNTWLPDSLLLEARESSSFLPSGKSWTRNMRNSDFYFCETQKESVSQYSLAGNLAANSEVLLTACNTDWRRWNQRPEEIKTASVLRSEREAKGAAPVFIRYRDTHNHYYVSTLVRFTESDEGQQTLAALLKNAGIPINAAKAMNENLSIKANGILSKALKDFWIWSPRSLENLLVEPNMPELHLSAVEGKIRKIVLNNQSLDKLENLPLKQGWNHFAIETDDLTTIRFQCPNYPEFLPQLKPSLHKGK
jgi:beta-galactosidase